MCINLCSVEITQAPINFNAPSKATRHVDYISPHGIACLLHSPHLNLWALVANVSHIGQVRIAPFSDDDTSFSYPPCKLLESRRDAAVPETSTLEEFRAESGCKQKFQNLVAPEWNPWKLLKIIAKAKGTLVLSGLLDYQITKCNIKNNVKSIEHLIPVTLSQWHPFFFSRMNGCKSATRSQSISGHGGVQKQVNQGVASCTRSNFESTRAASTEAWTTWHQRNSDRHSKCFLLANTIIVWNEMTKCLIWHRVSFFCFGSAVCCNTQGMNSLYKGGGTACLLSLPVCPAQNFLMQDPRVVPPGGVGALPK